MTDYPLPKGAELVTGRLIAGRYRIIRLASGRIALLRKDGLVQIAHNILNNILKERHNV